jgi:DNA invertase Pin-like site-specific DNA recombinase
MEIKTAAAYIRVSTEDQTEYSPDAQLRELREYAAAHSMILDDRFVYADEGISGRKADKRPAFQEMIRTAKLKDHPFDVILVHKFDRFARSREDSVVYKSMLKRCGVDVISIKEPLAEGSYSGVMEAIYESFAEAYSINLGTEVKKGMTEKARRGEIQTAPPYGYMLAQAKGWNAVGAVTDRPPSPVQILPPGGKVAQHGPEEGSPVPSVWAVTDRPPSPDNRTPPSPGTARSDRCNRAIGGRSHSPPAPAGPPEPVPRPRCVRIQLP